jgi:hypothetical protein
MTNTEAFFKALEGKEVLTKREWLKLTADATDSKESADALRSYLAHYGYVAQEVRITDKGKARKK